MPTAPRTHRVSMPRPRDDRPSPSRRGYGRAWQRIRAAKLQADPLCEDCKEHGRIVSAEHVDHVDNDRDNVDEDNLRSLCQPCHSRKTVKHDGGFGRRVERSAGAHTTAEGKIHGTEI